MYANFLLAEERGGQISQMKHRFIERQCRDNSSYCRGQRMRGAIPPLLQYVFIV